MRETFFGSYQFTGSSRWEAFEKACDELDLDLHPEEPAMSPNHITPHAVLVFAGFRPMDDFDLRAWEGCESGQPMLFEAGLAAIVYDETSAQIHVHRNGEQHCLIYPENADGAGRIALACAAIAQRINQGISVGQTIIMAKTIGFEELA
jgi:hypothetical protein